MGSFNTECLVSHQIIVPGTEVVILPILQQSTYNAVELYKGEKELSHFGFAHTTVYPTAFWGYAGPIIRGQYDDYGCFKLDDTEENNKHIVTFFNMLLKDSFNTKQGENSYHDHSFNMSEIYDSVKKYDFKQLTEIWEKMWEVASENRLFVNNYKDEPRNIQFAVIHHIAATYIIESVEKMKSYDKQSYEQKAYFKNYIKKILDRALKIFKDRGLDQVFSFFSTEVASLENYLIGQQEGCYLAQYYENWDDIVQIIKVYHNENPQSEEIPDNIIDQLFNEVQSQLDHRYIQMGLTQFNIKLSPMVYASQDYSNETGKNYAKMIQKISKEVTKEVNYEED